ncbi:MAG: penicillin-binding protein 2 [Alphaproteobacteria bacterium]|nr:penicillin-binding protein 2 [Alphaproteobacteria bacterium]
MSRRERREESRFTRRTLLLASAQGVLMTALLGRLVYLGGARSSHYTTLSQKNRVRLRFCVPPRGRLLDRTGMILAQDEMVYRLVFYPRETKDPVGALNAVKKVISLPLVDVHALAKTKEVQILKEPLSWEEVCTLEIQGPDLEAMSVEKGSLRLYPQRIPFCHITGYVQPPSKDEVTENPAWNLPDFRLGKEGAEKAFEELLQGTPGYREIEVNARGHEIRELTVKPGVQGKDLSLSIHGGLQRYVMERLATFESACCVVLHKKTGEVLCLASSPSYDPNLFVQGISLADWTTLRDNPYAALTNKSIRGQYAPGSLVKMIVALAALRHDKITPTTPIQCTGYCELNGHRYHCWRTHGSVNVVSALRESCDVFFYETAKKVGIDAIEKMARLLGLGAETGIELYGEKSGLVPGKAWKKKAQNRSWTVGDTILSSIGQGASLATPLQMALMMARLVGDGHAYTPTLLKDHTQALPDLGLDPKHLAVIREAMGQVVNHPSGTSYNQRLAIPGLEMGGKTATSQVRRISMKERKTRVLKNEEIEWQKRDHAIFAGYAPVADPRFVICVVIEHGGGGGRVATPVARDILTYAQQEISL